MRSKLLKKMNPTPAPIVLNKTQMQNKELVDSFKRSGYEVIQDEPVAPSSTDGIKDQDKHDERCAIFETDWEEQRCTCGYSDSVTTPSSTGEKIDCVYCGWSVNNHSDDCAKPKSETTDKEWEEEIMLLATDAIAEDKDKIIRTVKSLLITQRKQLLKEFVKKTEEIGLLGCGEGIALLGHEWAYIIKSLKDGGKDK